MFCKTKTLFKLSRKYNLFLLLEALVADTLLCKLCCHQINSFAHTSV